MCKRLIFLSVKVLPLTREWIEIPLVEFYLADGSVLPLTREWIEILKRRSSLISCAFSLLRGSGLKSNNL